MLRVCLGQRRLQFQEWDSAVNLCLIAAELEFLLHRISCRTMIIIVAWGAAAFAAQMLCILLLALPELRFAARPSPASKLPNLAIGSLLFAAQLVAQIWLGPSITLLLNMAHGGFFVLPASGWGLPIGIAIYVLAMDFGEYLFHRAQHAFPFLWKMHSLHHSDPQFGAATTIRHFWADPWLKSVTIWLVVGILFKASLLIVTIYAVISYYNFLTHANLRLNLGRASWLINSPAYHRLHHSALPEHFNSNYAALLPVFDVLFGGYRPPGEDEYPVTGLESGETPQSVLQVIAWPLRNWIAQASRSPAR